MGAFILDIKPSNIYSQYHGETSRAIAGIFKLACRLATESHCCILFIGMVPYLYPVPATSLSFFSESCGDYYSNYTPRKACSYWAISSSVKACNCKESCLQDAVCHKLHKLC